MIIMKRVIGFVMIIMLGSLLSACAESKESSKYISIDEDLYKEREHVNSIHDAKCASDGKYLYMIGYSDSLVYRVDFERYELVANCNDLLCEHEGDKCTAKLPRMENGLYSLRRNGDKIYALGNEIYEITENAKKKVGEGYGIFGCQIIFGNYIAYFKEDDLIVVEDIETGREVQRFSGVSGLGQGNFYYKDCLYYVTTEMQLVRLDLKTGAQTVLEEKGATRASVHEGRIYYIRISSGPEENQLIEMDPVSLEKKIILENVFYYNMKNDKLYYSTYPERHLYYSNMDGTDEKVIADDEMKYGWIWTFDQTDRFLLDGEDAYTFYILDENLKINYNKPLVLSDWGSTWE